MLTIDFNVFPQLVTERLVLRQMTEGDKEDVFQFRADPVAMEFIPRDLTVGVVDAVAKIEKANGMSAANEGVVWGITRKGENRVIGTILIFNIKQDARRAEVGYMLNTAYHRQGIMEEALRACVDYGFRVMGLNSLEAIAVSENVASAGLLEKVGFVKEGQFREYMFFRGAFYDAVLYSLLVNDWSRKERSV